MNTRHMSQILRDFARQQGRQPGMINQSPGSQSMGSALLGGLTQYNEASGGGLNRGVERLMGAMRGEKPQQFRGFGQIGGTTADAGLGSILGQVASTPQPSSGGSPISGAMSGAAAGSAAGPMGAIIGAVIGMATGAYKDKEEKRRREEARRASQPLFDFPR